MTLYFTGCLTIAICRRQGLKSHPTLVMLIVIIFSFTVATLYWASWMAFLTIQIRLALVENVGMELTEKRTLANTATARPGLIQAFSPPIMVS